MKEGFRVIICPIILASYPDKLVTIAPKRSLEILFYFRVLFL